MINSNFVTDKIFGQQLQRAIQPVQVVNNGEAEMVGIEPGEGNDIAVIEPLDVVTNHENISDANEGLLFTDAAVGEQIVAGANGNGMPQDQIVTDAKHGDNLIIGTSNIFTSTIFGGPSTSANFGSNELSSISVALDILTGTRQFIEQNLREAGVNLELDNQHDLLPTTASDLPQKNQSAIEPSVSPADQNGPLSPGSMALNMSVPENMIDVADRELLKIFHTF